ncbi:ATP synthase F1 subunit epsilon [Candidatus Uhrbacteria bacterium]|nr:ATP synthase F1 subunit epsilon [Candidatus Uhrbacteria bacterium]
MSLHVKLITPDRVLFDQEAISISLPTVDGEITVLPHHAPLTALLIPGIIRLHRSVEDQEEIAVSGGFIHVEMASQVMVLADTAERGQELDLSIIEQAKQRAQEVMKQTVNKDDVAFANAAAGLQRELARYRVANKHHGMKGVPMMDRSRIPHDENPT